MKRTKPKPKAKKPSDDWARRAAHQWWMDFFGGIKESPYDTQGINSLAALLRDYQARANDEWDSWIARYGK